jgi:hypothetical protein
VLSTPAAGQSSVVGWWARVPPPYGARVKAALTAAQAAGAVCT